MKLPALSLLAALQFMLAPVRSAVIYWENHVESSSYEIRSGDTVVLRGHNQVLGQLRIAAGGALTVDDARDSFLQMGNLDVSGSFAIGSAASPYSKRATFELLCLSDTAFPTSDERRKGVVVREGGAIELFGAKGARQSWTKLSDTAEAGAICLSMALPADWRVGDEIVLPSTDFDPHQTEKRTIVGARVDCVEVDSPLQFSHFGRVVQGVDERAEVGLLTRSIVFRGCREPSSELADVGGHMVFLHGFRRVQLLGVELQNFGQGDALGRYPLHFHMASRAPRDTFLRHNSIHASNFRAVVVHGTQGVTVAGNVAFNISGHAVFLEDGSETNNTFADNLVVLVTTKTRGARLGSDGHEGLSGFWLANADNAFTGNVAAAVEGAGFWLHTRLGVKGMSSTSGEYADVQPYRSRMREMRNNSVHSSAAGFRIESPQFDAQDSPPQLYSPPYTYMPDEPPVIEDFLVHHCRQGGWFRLFQLQLDRWVVADVTEGVQMLTQGNTPTTDVATFVSNSLFVGGTANRGNLVASDWQFVNFLERRSDSAINRASDMRTGVKLYDGPLYLTNCTFTRWYSQACLNYVNPAVGAREFNTFAMRASSFARDLVFTDTVFPVAIVDRFGDGGKTTSLVDASGSIAGRPGATVLPDWDFYATGKCDRLARFGLACPHKYANLDIVAVGSSDDPSKNGKLLVYRNNVESGDADALRSLDFSGQYIPASNGWLYHPIVSPGAVYTLRFEKDVPRHLSVVMSDTEHGQVFTLVVCYPAETSIQTVRSLRGEDLAQMASMADAECTNCYLYDAQHHVLLLRLRESGARVGLSSACPAAGCSGVDIVAEIPISDGVDDAFDYVLRELQVYDTTPTAWTQQQFVQEESASAFDLGLDLDWCSLDDPCLNAIDEGNRKAGVLAYLDKSCPGIGCFSSTCRYCKLSASTASAPFLPCPFESVLTSALAETPSSAPEDCASYLTAAETALHIDVVADTSCAMSGIGCISDGCRYCKGDSSPQYVPYLDCSSFGASASPTSTSTAGASPTPSASKPASSSTATLTPTLTPTPASPQLSLAPSTSLGGTPPTPSPTIPSPTPPASAAPATLGPSNQCSEVVPKGDRDVGVGAMVDASCAAGGVGCFSAQCRFCMAWSSPQSQNFVQCPTPSTPSPSPATPTPTVASPPTIDACWSSVSPGDIAAGVTAVSDASCRDGGLGCYSRSCRFCMTFETEKSSAYAPCSSVELPVTTASASTLPATATPTPTPAPAPTRSQDTFCNSLVPSGDREQGISALGDGHCADGGLGCLSATCRFCRTRSTPQSEHLYTCTELLGTRELAGLESVALPIDAGEPCLALVAQERATQGVYGFTDASCATESASDQCFTSTCRACKLADSPSVVDAPACPKYIAKAVEPPRALESAEAALSTADCTFALSVDGLSHGIAAYADTSCPPPTNARKPSSGCFARLGCRYCAFVATHGFPSCPAPAVAQSAFATENIPTEATAKNASTVIESHQRLTVASVKTETETSTATTSHQQQDFSKSEAAAYSVPLVTTLSAVGAVLAALLVAQALRWRSARAAADRARSGGEPSIMVIGGGDQTFPF